MTETHNPYTQQLRDELLKAAHKEKRARHRRSRRLKAFGPFGVVVVLIVAVVSFAFEQSSSSANTLLVQDANSVLTVQLNVASPSDREIVRELKAHNVNAAVVLEPAAAPQVGKFLSLGTASDDLKISSDTAGAFTSFSVKKGTRDQIHLYLGRPAQPGESYQAAFDAFSAGGALHCADVWGKPLGTYRSVLEHAFANVRYQTVNNGSGQGDLDNDLIVGSSQFSADSVSIVLAPAVTQEFQKSAPDTADC